MTLAEQLHRRLSDWRPTGSGRQTLTPQLPETGWNATISADTTDTVGCLAWEFALERSSPTPEGLTLKSWASDVAHRVTGLLERLTVVEVDDFHDTATLRSDVPTQRGHLAAFYEVALKNTTHATLSRWEVDRSNGGQRTRIPFAITHEALAKVAGDIAG